MTVYIDLLIVINLLVNYILIRLTAMLTATTANIKRLIFSSVIGALFSLIIVFEIPEFISLLIRIISVLLCVLFSFGFKNKYQFIKKTVILSGLYMFFTGFLIIMSESFSSVYVNNFSFYISINPVVFVGAICAFYLLINVAEFIFCCEPLRYIYDITITTQYGSFTTNAFYDTGFKVRDVLCNNAVVMCSLDYLDRIGMAEIANTVTAFYQKGIHEDCEILPLFYSDVTGGGMLPAFKTERIVIKKNNKYTELKNVLLAVSKKNFSHQHEVIFGKDIYDRLGD